MRQILIAQILVLGSCCLLAAQTSTIHFDKSEYFSGDYLFYSFCNAQIQDTVCAQVELQTESLDIVSYYVQMIGGCSQGFIKIPYDIKTGHMFFKITAHGKIDYQPVVLVQKFIPVFNTGENIKISSNANSDEEIEPKSSDKLSLSKTVFHRREEGLCLIGLDDEVGDILRVSISIRDAEVCLTDQKAWQVQKPTAPIDDLLEGIPFRGTRILQDQGTVNSPLLFALNPTNLEFSATQTDPASAQFAFELKPWYGSEKFSFFDYLDRNFTIESDNRLEQEFSAPSDFNLDSSAQRILDLAHQRKEINRFFKTRDLSITTDTLSLARRQAPNYEVDVQDFDIRGTTVSLFKELISPLKFKSIGKGEYRARMLYEKNDIKKYYSRAPLFVLNDATTRSGPFISKFPLQELKRFSIYSLYDDLARLSPIAFGGIVFVEMMDPNYTLPPEIQYPTKTLQGLQEGIQYPIQPKLQEHSPAVGQLLYWNPAIDIAESQGEVKFTTGDLNGTFLVEVVLHRANEDEPMTVLRQKLVVSSHQ